MLNRKPKRDESAVVGRPFGSDGGPDPLTNGRKGGVRSGESRRDRKRRELEQGIAASGNGAAKLELLKELNRQERARIAERERKVAQGERELRENLQRAQILLDRLPELEEHRDRLYADIEELGEGKEHLEADLASLKATIAELAAEHDLELVEEPDHA